VALLVALTGAAADPPHWTGAAFTIGCTTQCHTLHHAAGGTLTAAASNVALCQSCHSSVGLASDLPVDTANMADPTLGTGVHHAFGVAAVNPAFAVALPLNQAMSLRVMSGQVVCSTCHNQHESSSVTRGTPRVGRASQITALGSSGSVTAGGTFSGGQGVWYLLEIVTAGDEATARFRYSKDNGTSWFPTPPATLAVGVEVALDSGVTVSFAAGSYAAGERWELSAAWPFLRAALDLGENTGDAYCRDCHRAWTMDTQAVETWDGTPKSHPVGVLYTSGGAGYHPVPLDGNGAPQGSAGADGNTSNDLALDAAGYVQCLTCHGVHGADSNTLTEDLR